MEHYKVLKLNRDYELGDDLEQVLNLWAARGWKVHTCHVLPGHGWHIILEPRR